VRRTRTCSHSPPVRGQRGSNRGGPAALRGHLSRRCRRFPAGMTRACRFRRAAPRRGPKGPVAPGRSGLTGAAQPQRAGCAPHAAGLALRSVRCAGCTAANGDKQLRWRSAAPRDRSNRPWWRSRRSQAERGLLNRWLFDASSHPLGIVGHLTAATWGQFPSEAGQGSKGSSATNARHATFMSAAVR
jgi:hypothetical protein